MQYVKNREQLISHGNKELREIALDIIDHAIFKADPYIVAKELVKLSGDILTVGKYRFDLRKHKRIFVLGGGKATYPIAKALDEILQDRITNGAIVCKYGQEGDLSHIRMHFGSHPVPDENGFRAACEIMDIAKNTKEGDIVFACITGGSTSLMAYPQKGISLEDKQKAYRLLLRSSANIIEMNEVRKHMTALKGGLLAKAIHPGAHIINLTVSDVIGDPIDYITSPTVPDTSTFDDARSVLTKYHLWDKMPESIVAYIKNGNEKNETPKDLSDHNIYNFILVRSDAACLGAAEKAEEMGYHAMILSTMFEGESKELGNMYAAVAKEIILNQRPFKAPCIIIGGGETTMKIGSDPGEGGPNQQFALASSMWISNLPHVVIAGIDTDGTDGVSDFAGGMVDCTTAGSAIEKDIDIYDYVSRFDDSVALRALGDGVYTGVTGTNVNDLKIMVIDLNK